MVRRNSSSRSRSKRGVLQHTTEEDVTMRLLEVRRDLEHGVNQGMASLEAVGKFVRVGCLGREEDERRTEKKELKRKKKLHPPSLHTPSHM